MRAFVFTNPALTSQAGRFVWLAINTERAENAPFLKRYPVPALPTFFIVDPSNQAAVLRWVGGATVPQMEKILADGESSVSRGRLAGRTPASRLADHTLARADSLYGAGQDSAAAVAFTEAIRRAPAGWPHYSRAVESLLFALDRTGDGRREAEVARDAFPRVRRTASAANVASSGLEAALGLPDSAGGRAALVTVLERDSRAIVSDRSVSMAADDRSGVYIALLDARKDAHDSTGASRVAAEWASFLEGEAAKAKTPDARMVFDSHRLAAYLELDHAERAIPMLEQSERDAPDDYNPPARLAVAYRALKRWNDALAASDRALARAYGPRKLGMYQVRCDIYLGLRDTTGARKTLESALSEAEALPPGQRSERTIEGLRHRIGTLR
ncbi:MAG TPA: hypothetical protein VL123_04065 [Candidatus Udaeobacter sp.]|jgi:tetratricopeptide (TPR) repeat protein|nr:hypothetical protein [Candidatus Udaeobacter sp.]